MSVTQEAFDALVARVEKLESLTERTWSIIGHLDTSIRIIHDKLAQHDERFDNVDRKLDEILRKLS